MDTYQSQYINDCGTVDAAASRGIAVASSASANTKGAWVKIGSTAYYGAWLTVSIETDEAGADFLVDIGLGETASEVVVIANLFISGATAAGTGRIQQFCLPMTRLYPTGGAIQARCQSTGSSKTVYVSTHEMVNSYMPQQIVTTYGADTAATAGVQIDPGGTAHTKGAYSEITAATTKTTRGFFLCFGGQTNVAMTTASWLVDIATGAGGSEQVILPNLPLRVYGATSVVTPGNTVFLPFPIASGTRVSARAQCSINDAADRLIDVILYTVS